MKWSALLLPALFFVLNPTYSFAGDCNIHYTRTACPGKEEISYKKCDGKQSCSKTVQADSAETCRMKAVTACANDRPNITQSKVISATFNNKPVMNKSGQEDHCQDYADRATEFNQCGS